MNLFSLLSFGSFMIFLTLGIYAWKLDPDNRANRSFVMLAVSLTIWALAYTFVYPAHNKIQALNWIKIAAIGVVFVPGILLQFILSLTLPPNKTRKWWTYPLYYLPGLIFLIRTFLVEHVTVGDIGLGKWGWYEIVRINSAWFWIFNVYFAVYLLSGFFYVMIWGRKSMRLRQKKQSKLVGYSLLITIVLSYLSDIILPLVTELKFPSIAPVFFLVMAGGLWLSSWKYQLLKLTPEIAADEIISKINEILFLVNSQGYIIQCNPKSMEVLKYTSREMRGSQVSDFMDMKSFNKNLVKDGNLILQQNYITDVDFITKEGESIPVEMTCSPIKDRANEVIGLMIMGQDLRMRYQLQALEKEREYHELKTRFITTASHEFRTPLSAILLSTETLEKRYELMDEEKKKEYFKRIYLSVHRMKTLLGDVLTLEKMSSQSIKANIVSIALEPFIKDIKDEHMMQEANIHDIDLKFHKSTPEKIYTDPKLLKNIVSNLIANARQYSPEACPIEIMISQPKDKVRITVKDDGIGIPPDEIEMIFDSFHRAKNIGNISGTGLGLAIVRNSLVLLGGTIKVESKENRGSRFTIDLPYLDPPVQ